MLRCCLILSCLLVAVLSGEMYTSKYDNVNVKEILENKRLLKSYCDCLLDRGKCSVDGKELKANMGDALKTGCRKCTETQKEKARQIIDHLIKHERSIWNELTAKYDPDGVWRKKYEEQAKQRGIIIPKD